MSLIVLFLVASSCSKKPRIETYLLLGQSNMAGRGAIEAIDTVTNPKILTLSDNEWVIAKPPFNVGQPSEGTGVLGLYFAKTLLENDPDLEIRLIPCAIGGTSISDWQKGGYSELRKLSPYANLMKSLSSIKKPIEISGILWHLGETDSRDSLYLKYQNSFISLLNSLCSDTNISFTETPIVVGELGQFVYWRPGAEEINVILKKLSTEYSNIRIASSENLTDLGDTLHFNIPSQREFGRRYAIEMIELQNSME